MKVKLILIFTAFTAFTALHASYASAQTKEAVTAVAMGESRESVCAKLGEPDCVSGNGSKEVYGLENGGTAVLRYDGDILKLGFIVER